MVVPMEETIMPWQEVLTVSLRKEFIILASHENANISRLSQRFKISRKTAYKWLRRHREKREPGLMDISRRPLTSPKRITSQIESLALSVRDEHPAWGARKAAGEV
jgi:transposase